MVITVTLNPALDKTLYFDGHFVPGKLNRVRESTNHAGGKGINVARMYRLLGVKATAVAFLGGDSGKIMSKKLLNEEEVICHFVATEAETRSCYKIIDGYGVCTEANESGGPIREEDLRRLISSLDRLIGECGEKGEDVTLFLCGSVPPGIEKDIYGAMIRRYRKEHVKIVLDADGEALKAGLEEEPYLIKPNEHELRELCGQEIRSAEDAARISRSICDRYHTRVLCTMGEKGAVYTDRICSLYVSAPKVELKGFTGAGDTFLASFVYFMEKSDGDSEAALRFAAGAAAAKIEMVGTAFPGRDRITKYLDQTTVRQISSSV